MRRALRLVAGAALAVGATMVVAPPASAVDSPQVDDSGWWTRIKQEPTLGAVVVFPDVTPGQLLVEGTPEGATAIAAIRATLPEGTGEPVLTLQAASSLGAEAAILLACQSGSGWTGAYAGAWDAKPSPDCSRSVQGIPSEDGTEWSFALSALQFGQQIDVVLTPGVIPESQGGASSAFRIVFDRPGVDAIAVTEGAAPTPSPAAPVAPPPSGGASGGAPPRPATGGVTAGGSPSFSVPAPPTPSSLASQPAQAALPADEQGATATAPALAPQPLAAPPLSTSGADGRALGVLVVLLAGALLWWSSQQPVPERRVLSRFAAAAPSHAVASPTEEVVGGLGRFRRARTAPARPLG